MLKLFITLVTPFLLTYSGEGQNDSNTEETTHNLTELKNDSDMSSLDEAPEGGIEIVYGIYYDDTPGLIMCFDVYGYCYVTFTEPRSGIAQSDLPAIELNDGNRTLLKNSEVYSIQRSGQYIGGNEIIHHNYRSTN